MLSPQTVRVLCRFGLKTPGCRVCPFRSRIGYGFRGNYVITYEFSERNNICKFSQWNRRKSFSLCSYISKQWWQDFCLCLVWKWVWIFVRKIWKRVWKMAFFLSEIGSGHLELLEKREAHPNQEFQGETLPRGPLSFTKWYFASTLRRRFLSCMAPSVYEVVHVACQSRVKSTTDGNYNY